MGLAESAMVEVLLAHSPTAGVVEQMLLSVPVGTTVAGALAAAQAVVRWPHAAACSLAVWGRRAEPEQVLCAGDRIELLRPLTADPKESRRQRYRKTPGRQGGIERGRGRAPARGRGSELGPIRPGEEPA